MNDILKIIYLVVFTGTAIYLLKKIERYSCGVIPFFFLNKMQNKELKYVSF